MESRESERKRKEIIDLLANIKEHFKRLEEYSNIPTLELNVILSKIAKLQEKTAILKYLMSKKEETEFETDNHGQSNETKTGDIELEPTASEESPQKSKIEKSANGQNKISEGSKEESSVFVDTAETSTGKGIGKIEDYLDLNAKFSNEEHSLSEQLKKQPISNLLTAIGLNERYLFANQLFNGDMAQFIDEIKKLNSFESEGEALDYFDNELSNKDSWKSSEDLVQAFRLLIERRFQQC